MVDRLAVLELKALRAPQGHDDVAVLGGGLAGLTSVVNPLAISLHPEQGEALRRRSIVT